MLRLRVGLRSRVTALFAAGALGLSLALALATYGVTRSNLIAERERTAVRATAFDAVVVRQGITAADAEVVEVLQRLDTGTGRRPLVRRGGEAFVRGADTGLTEAVTDRMVRLVEQDRQSAVQRVVVQGQPAVVVGVPLAPGEAYYEVVSLVDVEDTLQELGRTLTLVSALTTVGGALAGYWAGRRLLRPLRSVATAAQRIGEGDLSARLEESDDPDLEPITTSFNTMVDELAARLDRDRRFAADVSHELRSPLQTLTAASSVLANRADALDPRSASAALLVAEEAGRFTALVQDLLELARDELPVHLQDTDVAAQLREVVREAAPVLDVAHAPATWRLDRRRFERLVSNLVDNAERHGGGAVRVGASVEDGRLVVEVDDAGPGVPVEERELVFDRFGRGRAASARGDSDGTGLGLSLVAQHAAAHGGTVTVLDRPGGGARFRVELPA